jgi:prevent-host-death family protein
MTKWPLQDAKNRLSEVVRKASAEGPQVITLRGDDAVVVIAANEYAQLVHKREGSLVDFFSDSPLVGVSLDLTRDRDTGRQLTL